MVSIQEQFLIKSGRLVYQAGFAKGKMRIMFTEVNMRLKAKTMVSH